MQFNFSLCDISYRKKGIGKRLFNESIEFFKNYLKEDFNIALAVRKSNIASIKIAESNGSEVYGKRKLKINNENVKFLYYKKLITV